MKLKNKIKTILCASLLMTSATSCSDWLDVKMEDSIMENMLFSNNEGYQTALNGIYLNMISLYVDDLSAGKLDVMAQYYNVTENHDHAYKIYSGYKLDDDSFEYFLDNVWSKAYNLIANNNVLLEHCDADDATVSSEYYPIVKGEALAIRAMLHFDLLRLFGPVYNESSASQKCIPYQLSSSKDIQPLLSASEVLQNVIKDLEAASALLKDADPIITEGVRITVENDNGLANNNLNYRQLRLNYYAVQALLARAYAWGGNTTKAYEIAKNEIIDKITTEDLEIFPWTTEAAFRADGKPDKLFSSEVFFAIYNVNRAQTFSNLFSSAIRPLTGRLTFPGTNFTDSKIATFYDDDNDWRREMWEIAEPTEQEMKEAAENNTEATSSLFLTKYQEVSYDANLTGTEMYRYMVPLIRLSEVYLIAAEGAPTREEALGYINTVRAHRSCRNLEGDNFDLQETITAEFAREVIGEGQLFYYYKRLGMEQMISGTAASGTYGMVLSNYVMPLPSSETDKRVM